MTFPRQGPAVGKDERGFVATHARAAPPGEDKAAERSMGVRIHGKSGRRIPE
jgi:hypothetical protein